MNQEYTYTIVLTHDVDHIALRDYAITSRYMMAFVKNAAIRNFLKLLQKYMPVNVYIKSLAWAFAVPLVKIGIIKDPMKLCIRRILKIEEEYGVRSTFYFIPFKNNPGFRDKDNPAPPQRGAAYDITQYKELLNTLDAQGWEVGSRW